MCGERREIGGDLPSYVFAQSLCGSYLKGLFKQVRFIRSDPYLHILSRTLIDPSIRVPRVQLWDSGYIGGF